MKRAYQRPIVCFQNFALSNQVSSGCEGIANIGENQCSIWLPDAGISIFMIDVVCEFPPTDGDTICYNAPTEWNNVYSS
ncbi:MAG: hypothetical protein IKS21_02120 [Oscillospiraceae bacterium]|nr:hypothetical protein [Oscillospiraceae bacterium]